MTDALELGSDGHFLKEKCLLRKMKSEMPNTLEGSCNAPIWYFGISCTNPDWDACCPDIHGFLRFFTQIPA